MCAYVDNALYLTEYKCGNNISLHNESRMTAISHEQRVFTAAMLFATSTPASWCIAGTQHTTLNLTHDIHRGITNIFV